MTKETSEAPQSTSVVAIKGQKRWDLMCEDFIAQNLRLTKDDPPYTLKDCAAAWGVSYPLLRQKAATQKWNIQLKERLERLRLEAQEKIQNIALFDEIEIRTRQATYARHASLIAYQKLKGLDEKAIAKMSIKDAVELLKIGLSEERQALGIGDTLRVPPAPGQGDKPVLNERQVFAVARRVLEMRKLDDGSYAERTEPEAAESAADGGGSGDSDLPA